MEYFDRLLDLLNKEREQDRATYQQLLERSSVAERRLNGLSWYPVAIRDTEMSRGDYLTVELERTTHQDISHQLRFGAAAALFSNHDPKTDRVEGVISHQSGNKLRLTLRTDELPDWTRRGKLGIDLLFDENSYEEMQMALRQTSRLAEKREEGKLIAVLTGEKEPAFDEDAIQITNTSLNPSQREAVEKIVKASDLAIVHGPPGTGKTTTLVEAIRAMLARDSRTILVAAPSNAAVDLLSEKLSLQGLNIVRIGNPVRVSPRLTELTLESRIAAHPASKDIRKLKKQASEYRSLAHKYKRQFGKAERDQRKALFDEAHRIMKDVENTEQYISEDILSRAQVITATLVGANHYTVRHLKYHTAVIDEAGQALEPACWIAILKAKKLVMAGDHFQLPPTIKSEEAAKGGLATTLLEKSAKRYPGAVVLLEEQYRMNELIMAYSSAVFYQNRLRADASVAQQTLFPGDDPMLFIDTSGCGFEEKAEGTSTSNPEEASFLFRHLLRVVGEWTANNTGEAFPSIAIISPYKGQVQQLQEELEKNELLMSIGDRVSVNTIDSFQGQERDIVYISFARSNGDGQIGFLSDIRRTNVAMTRARKKLVMIGDGATLCSHSFYAGLISFAEQHNAWKSAWEFYE